MNIKYSRLEKPPIKELVLFHYQNLFHLGYLDSDEGSKNPRNWHWYSYVKNYGDIYDIVRHWWVLPEEDFLD